jgi:hypothetical protein
MTGNKEFQRVATGLMSTFSFVLLSTQADAKSERKTALLKIFFESATSLR